MTDPNIDPSLSDHSAGSGVRWLIAGHPSSSPARVAALFAGNVASCEIAGADSEPSSLLVNVDACALVINAKTGVSQEMIIFWNYLAERQFPRLVIVNGLELSEIDFDDIAMIANRVLEQVVTPFLVLHDDLGEPIGLISLDDLHVHDYSQKSFDRYPADQELKELITDFREEYLDQTNGLDDSSLQSGLVVPALPLIESRGIGIAEIQRYLDLVTRL